MTKCSLRGSEPAAKQRVENCPIVVSDHNYDDNDNGVDDDVDDGVDDGVDGVDDGANFVTNPQIRASPEGLPPSKSNPNSPHMSVPLSQHQHQHRYHHHQHQHHLQNIIINMVLIINIIFAITIHIISKDFIPPITP